MKNCEKCNKEIKYGEDYYTIVHHIESTKKDAAGNLYVQVISSEELIIICEACGVNQNSKTTQKLIKGFVSQNARIN